MHATEVVIHKPQGNGSRMVLNLLRKRRMLMGEAALPEEAEQVLRKFFDEMSTFMINQLDPGMR
jgi:hypothetical protein